MVEHAVIIATASPFHQSSLTQDRPPAMLPALGKPMIIRVMDHLYRAGIRHYRLIVGLNEGAVASYLNRQWVPNAKVEFTFKSDTESLLQTLIGITKEDPSDFLITGYNNLTLSQFIPGMLRQHALEPEKLHLAGARSTLSQGRQQYYASVTHNAVSRITTERAFSDYILANLAIAGRHFINNLGEMASPGSFHAGFLALVQQYILTNPGYVALQEAAWTLQVDTDQDLLTLNRRLLDEANDAHILSDLPYTVRIIPPVRIDPQVSVGQGATIGPYVYLERGSRIGYGAEIRNAVILQNSTVEPRSVVENTIISSRGNIST